MDDRRRRGQRCIAGERAREAGQRDADVSGVGGATRLIAWLLMLEPGRLVVGLGDHGGGRRAWWTLLMRC